MEPQDLPFRSRFWNSLCGFSMFMHFLFALCAAFLVLIVLTYVVIGTDEVGRALLQVNLLVLAILMPTLVYSIRRCRKRERR